MTDSNENTAPPKSTESRNSNSSVQIQIKPKFQFEFLPRDTAESLFLNLVDFGVVVFCVGNVMSSLFWKRVCIKFFFAFWGLHIFSRHNWYASICVCTCVCVYVYVIVCVCVYMWVTVSTEITTSLKSTISRISDSSVSRGTHSNCDFG